MTTKTGIPGFDPLVSGGLPKNMIVLLSGTPGTGKTIFGLQYIYAGATKFNEKGLYVTFEEGASALKQQAKMFGWDFDALEKKGMARILTVPASKIKETTAKDLLRTIADGGYNRLVVDSITALAINTPTTFVSAQDITDISIKRFLHQFITDMRASQTTALLIAQTTDDKLSCDGVSEFACDGIIHFKHEPLGGEFSRHMTVRKMRQRKNCEDIHPVEIGKDGIVIHQLE